MLKNIIFDSWDEYVNFVYEQVEKIENTLVAVNPDIERIEQ